MSNSVQAPFGATRPAARSIRASAGLARRCSLGVAACMLLAVLAAGAANAAGATGTQGTPGAAPAAPKKTLRFAFVAAETGFDPARISDLYSRYVAAHVFEAPYRYDYLAEPAKIVPNTAEALPEVSPDFRNWTLRIRPGIFFTDDPAFKGQPRELTAADYVFSYKRFFDPAVKSPAYSDVKEHGALGVEALRAAALERRAPFDYDTEVEGVRATGRYTLQFKLAEPRPRFLYALADNGGFAAVAREVVAAHGEAVGEHPVGTGPFKLAEWRRSSFIALERNRGFREQFYDAEPAAGDAEGQALLARFKGRRLPMLDRVEVSIIDEGQPRWLAFLNEELDLAFPVPPEFIETAAPGGRLAPHLARRGIKHARVLNADHTLTYFNMQDATVGGYAAGKVALRRALSLAVNVQREIDVVRRGQAIAAQSIVAPGIWGYDPELRIGAAEHSPARANALLDVYGYTDQDGDGWRDLPGGAPLVVRYASSPDATSRQYDELWHSSMNAIRVRVQIDSAQWPEQLKAARAGKLMIWQLGSTASTPDVQPALASLYGPAAGGSNLARFAMTPYDDTFRRMQALPDGPERLAALRELQKLSAAYAPHKYHVHRILNDLSQPWLIGFRRPRFGNQWWQYVDIDRTPATNAREAAE